MASVRGMEAVGTSITQSGHSIVGRIRHVESSNLGIYQILLRTTSEQIIFSDCFDSGLIDGLFVTISPINHHFLPFLVNFSVSQKSCHFEKKQ